MKSDVKGNAHRLAYTLYQFAEDTNTINQLARLLHYMPEQLKEDMEAVHKYLNQLEKEVNTDTEQQH